MKIYLSEEQAQCVDVQSFKDYEYVVSCFYLGSSLVEIATTIHDPRRAQDRAETIRVAYALGMDLEVDRVTVGQTNLFGVGKKG